MKFPLKFGTVTISQQYVVSNTSLSPIYIYLLFHNVILLAERCKLQSSAIVVICCLSVVCDASVLYDKITEDVVT